MKQRLQSYPHLGILLAFVFMLGAILIVVNHFDVKQHGQAATQITQGKAVKKNKVKIKTLENNQSTFVRCLVRSKAPEACIKRNNIPGSSGAPGKQGQRGLQGLQGPTGPQGPSGVAGKDAAPVTITDLTDALAQLCQTHACFVTVQKLVDAYQQYCQSAKCEGPAGPKGDKGDPGTPAAPAVCDPNLGYVCQTPPDTTTITTPNP